MAIYDINGNVLSSGSTSDVSGGTWLALGDSIAQYMSDGGYCAIVEEKLGLAKRHSYATAGAMWECTDTSVDLETTTVKGNVFGQYNSMKNDVINGIYKPTIITIALGTNGASQGEFWADESTKTINKNTTTMAGAMHTILQKLLSDFSVADVRIGGIIPPQAEGRNSELKENWKVRNDLIRRIYEFYSIPYLDLAKEGYILDKSIVDNGTLGDWLHPSAVGNKTYARRLCGWLPTL